MGRDSWLDSRPVEEHAAPADLGALEGQGALQGQGADAGPGHWRDALPLLLVVLLLLLAPVLYDLGRRLGAR